MTDEKDIPRGAQTGEIREAVGRAIYLRLEQRLGVSVPQWESLSPDLRLSYIAMGDEALLAYAEHGHPASSGDFYRHIEEIQKVQEALYERKRL